MFLSTIHKKNKSAVVAVIGGGPAAVSLCAQFALELEAKNCRQTVDFWVFERQATVGGGLPFSGKDDSFLLNLPTDLMEPIYGRRGDFTAWTLGNTECPKDTEYPPRRFFGEYLNFVALETQKKSVDFGLKIHFRTNTEVTGVRKGYQGDYVVNTNTDFYLRADYVCICTGHSAPKRFEQLEGQKNFCPNPWAPGALNFPTNLAKNGIVAVLGTRLTAIDVVRKLKSNGHQGKILMVSRSGLLPTVWPHTIQPYHLRHLTLAKFFRLTKSGTQHLKLTDLISLVKAEIEDAEGADFLPKFFATSTKQISPLDWLNREIEPVELNLPKKWLDVIFSFYPLIPDLWPLLSEADQSEFFHHHYSLFLNYLVGIPVENARRIRDYLVAGEIEVRGGLTGTFADGNFFKLKFDDGSEVAADWVINATGCDRDVQADPLTAQMIEAGLVTPHPLGGIKVDPASLRTFDAKNCQNVRLAAVGTLTRGAALKTADMTTVANQASRVAAWMAEDICQSVKN